MQFHLVDSQLLQKLTYFLVEQEAENNELFIID